ncbi:proline-rich protein HaeIII subfamily 1-like [Mustela nigripes]|uniref:proline-rich protein HaeIII subfamily 1-like n=1 Tax=Mustela nigripes TaxID=77151 RepID=UPI002815C52C|nr:proline-rich protein HaeIII subfamily 1-like [Mustela nigripes]
MGLITAGERNEGKDGLFQAVNLKKKEGRFRKPRFPGTENEPRPPSLPPWRLGPAVSGQERRVRAAGDQERQASAAHQREVPGAAKSQRASPPRPRAPGSEARAVGPGVGPPAGGAGIPRPHPRPGTGCTPCGDAARAGSGARAGPAPAQLGPEAPTRSVRDRGSPQPAAPLPPRPAEGPRPPPVPPRPPAPLTRARKGPTLTAGPVQHTRTQRDSRRPPRVRTASPPGDAAGRRGSGVPSPRPGGARADAHGRTQTSTPRQGAEILRHRASGRAFLGGRGRPVAGAAAVFLPRRLSVATRPGPRGRTVGKPAGEPPSAPPRGLPPGRCRRLRLRPGRLRAGRAAADWRR